MFCLLYLHIERFVVDSLRVPVVISQGFYCIVL